MKSEALHRLTITISHWRMPAIPSSPMKKGATSNSFPALLHKLVSDEPDSIVEFLPDGVGFRVNHLHLFTTRVLPTYFKHAKLASFLRQLNLYSFSVVKHEAPRRAYRHAAFVRDRPELLAALKCRR